MPFKKGQSGNAKGRPHGARGRVPTNVREFIKDVIDKNRTKINADLRALDPKERLDILVKLMGFVVPKPQSILLQDLTPTDNNLSRVKDIDNAPDEVREGYYNYLDWVINESAKEDDLTNEPTEKE